MEARFMVRINLREIKHLPRYRTSSPERYSCLRRSLTRIFMWPSVALTILEVYKGKSARRNLDVKSEDDQHSQSTPHSANVVASNTSLPKDPGNPAQVAVPASLMCNTLATPDMFT